MHEIRGLERPSAIGINREDNNVGGCDRSLLTTSAHPAARKIRSRIGRTTTIARTTNASAAIIVAHLGQRKIHLRFMSYVAQSRHRPTSSTICRCGAKPARAAASCSRRVELDVLDLVAPSALLAEEQRAMMRVTKMLAGRIGVAALDLVDKAVLEKKIERAIDGRRRDGLALAPRKLVDDRIGPERA